MYDVLKKIGYGTPYQFDRNGIYMPLPSRNNNSKRSVPITLDNVWYDKCGQKYEVQGNYLIIEAQDYFNESGFNIIDFINKIPKEIDLDVVLRIKSRENETAGFNMLCNLLSLCPTSKNILLDITHMNFTHLVALDIDDLPKNIKITSMLNREYSEQDLFSNESFESWALNLDNKNFELLASKLTAASMKRITKLREIVSNFYRALPNEIKMASDKEKFLYIFKWCCSTIKYDISACNLDGTLKYDRKDSQDPINTFEKRLGVCEGRARLIKALLNNCYIKIPCFLVKGKAGRLQHTWNETIIDNDIIDFDISNQANREGNNHQELDMYNTFINVAKKNKKRI